MKIPACILPAIVLLFGFTSFSQTADEIIEKYLEKSGGEENWSNLTATKMIAEVENEGMTIPLTIYNTKEGKQAVVINYMGQEITQLAYDGEILWTTDSNMEPQMADEESTKNMAFSKNDFPNPFLNYKNNNYRVKLIGKEKVNGRETYKVLIEQEPITIEGVEEESMSYYYFDVKNHLPIMVETEIKGGPMAGHFATSTMKNYKSVNGLSFPFIITENGEELTIKEIILNPEIDDSVFAFPEQ